MFVIGKACCVSTGFEGVVIGSLSFVKFVFVAGDVYFTHPFVVIDPPFSPIVINAPLLLLFYFL